MNTKKWQKQISNDTMKVTELRIRDLQSKDYLKIGYLVTIISVYTVLMVGLATLYMSTFESASQINSMNFENLKNTKAYKDSNDMQKEKMAQRNVDILDHFLNNTETNESFLDQVVQIVLLPPCVLMYLWGIISIYFTWQRKRRLAFLYNKLNKQVMQQEVIAH